MTNYLDREWCMKLKTIISILFILVLVISYSFLTLFSKDVVNTVLIIVGTVFAVVTFFYTLFLRLIEKHH